MNNCLNKSVKEAPPALPYDPRKKEIKKLAEFSLFEIKRLAETRCEPFEYQFYGEKNGEDVVFILPEAWEKLTHIIDWGKRTPTNTFEQIYQGMGYCFTDGKRRILVITYFLYIYAANRSPTSACINDGEQDSIMRRIEIERGIIQTNEAKCNITPDGKYVYNPYITRYGCSKVNAYCHTHPGIGTFFSYDDKTSGYATPDNPSAIMVADPIKKEIKARVGIEQRDAQVIVCEKITNNKSLCSKSTINSRSDGTNDANISGIKSKEMVIKELGSSCNELLNPIYGSRGNYSVRTSFTGKEHIKVNISIKPKKSGKYISREQ